MGGILIAETITQRTIFVLANRSATKAITAHVLSAQRTINLTAFVVAWVVSNVAGHLEGANYIIS